MRYCEIAVSRLLEAARLEPTKVVNGERVTAAGKPLPEHIAALRIPPAWTNVTFSADPNADLLVVGTDAKGRRQPIYSAAHWSKQAAVKYSKIKELDRKFGTVVKQNDRARQSDDPRIQAAADCAALIIATGIRPGSDTDTLAEKKAYGATTLEGQHVVPAGDDVRLVFTGKKGVPLDILVQDPTIVEMLLRRKQAAGDTGQLFPIDARQLLRYVNGFDGGGFRPKDIRTYLGTKTAMNEIAQMTPPATERDYKKAVRAVATAVSQKLGNTPTVALQSYISPAVWSVWRMQ